MGKNKSNDSIKQNLENGAKRDNDKEEDNTLISIEQVLPNTILIVPIPDKPIFPGMMIPLTITNRHISKNIIKNLENDNQFNDDQYIGLMFCENYVDNEILIEDLPKIGTLGKIVKDMKLPDGGLNLLVNTLERFKIEKILNKEKYKVTANISYPEEIEPDEDDIEVKAILRTIIGKIRKIASEDNFLQEQIKLTMANVNEPGTIADFIMYVLNTEPKEHQEILDELDIKERLRKVHISVMKEIEVLEMQQKIQKKIEEQITTQQREYFLKEQLKLVKKELGIETDPKAKEIKIFQDKIDKLKIPKEIKEQINNEFEKFKIIDRMTSEYTVLRNYIELITELPWNIYSEEVIDIHRAEKILNKDHFGLEDVKERILEIIAVRQLKKDTTGTIICLVGPPGVGKTSLGQSIAKALNRKFFRFSLGGMRDEAEIKGHRRTYVGSMPGKIINALKFIKTSNPVIMLDEVDKLGKGFSGDPASALLEVLDPEQNNSFIDHYLDLPYDLSQVLFITTANTLDTIPKPLIDRMEVIRLSGYIDEEKYNIARKYLVPKQIKKHGMKRNQLGLSKDIIMYIIDKYARESGVRNLERMINKICRKIASKIVKGEEYPVKPNKEHINDWLGSEIYNFNKEKKITKRGMMIGLAWTELGGDTLMIEAIFLPDNKGNLKITGQVGDVMSESANIAYSYVRSVSNKYKISKDFFEKNLIHLHIPAGATPKDGPSAGITMASAILSLATNKLAKENVAMTGELTLVGNVLPIGGLKEKVIAAKRTGIKKIIFPSQNEKDLKEIPEYIKKGLEFNAVEHIEEVFDLAIRKD